MSAGYVIVISNILYYSVCQSMPVAAGRAVMLPGSPRQRGSSSLLSVHTHMNIRFPRPASKPLSVTTPDKYRFWVPLNEINSFSRP